MDAEQLGYILLVLLGISIVASLLSIYVIFTKNLRKPGIRLMLYVTISDILGSLGWLVTLVNSECPFLGGLSLFSFTASSIWLAFIGKEMMNARVYQEYYLKNLCLSFSPIDDKHSLSICRI